MGLLRSFENGTQTDLTSLKYGKDRPGGGSSNEPYLFNPLLTQDSLLSGLFPQNFSGVSPGSLTSFLPNLIPGANTDAIIRGGLAAPLHAADDVARLSRMFFDTKDIGGALFNIKQLVLSKIAPRTQRSKGLLNEGGFNPANILKQAGLGYTGFHTEKQSPIFGSITKYLDVVQDVDDTQLTQLATPPIGPALPSPTTPDIDNDNIPDLIDPNSENPPTVASNSRVAGLYFIHDAGFPTKNKALSQFKVDNPNINVYSYRGGPGSVLGIGRTTLRLATDVAGAPIKVEKFSFNSFTENQPYIGSGAEYRLIFINTNQYNYINYFDLDNGFNTSFGGIYDNNTSFFTLAKKQDNKAFLKTPSPDDPKFGNPLNYSLPYQSLTSYKGGRLGNFYSLYYRDKIVTESGDQGTVDSFNTGTSIVNIATKQDGLIPLKTYKITTTNSYQWGSNYLKNLTGARTSVEKTTGIPRTNVGIKPNFTKKVSVYNVYATPYNSKTILDKRIKQGSPGGYDSRTAYRPGGAVSYHNPELVVRGANKTNATQNIHQLKPALDKLNAMGVYSAKSPQYNLPDIPTDDIIKFNIGIINNSNPSRAKYIHFRAFLNDVSDNYSSNWDSVNYVGRAEKFYNYTGGFERKISTSFIVAAQSKAELIPMYKKLNFLASAIAGDYTGAGYLAGNLMELTIGGYVYRTPGFLSGINYTLKQGYPWEIGIGETTAEGFGIDTDVAQLCHYVEVDGFDFTVIHDFLPTVASVPDTTTTRFISLQDELGNRYNSYGDISQSEIQQEKLAELYEQQQYREFTENLPEDVDEIDFGVEEIEPPTLQDNVNIVEITNEDGSVTYEVESTTTLTTETTEPSPDPDTPDATTPNGNIVEDGVPISEPTGFETSGGTGGRIFVSGPEDFDKFEKGDIIKLDLDGNGYRDYKLQTFIRGSFTVLAAPIDGEDRGTSINIGNIFMEEDPNYFETLDEVVIKPPIDTTPLRAKIDTPPFKIPEGALQKVEPIETERNSPPPSAQEAQKYSDFRDKLGEFATISDIEDDE